MNDILNILSNLAKKTKSGIENGDGLLFSFQ